jgi:predicted transcriptional regulator
MIELTGEKLRELREKYSIPEIAKQFQVSPATISRYIKIAKLPAKKAGNKKINFIGEE